MNPPSGHGAPQANMLQQHQLQNSIANLLSQGVSISQIAQFFPALFNQPAQQTAQPAVPQVVAAPQGMSQVHQQPQLTSIATGMPHQQLAAVAAATSAVNSNHMHAHQPQQVMRATDTHLAWPINSPSVQIPYFDPIMYKNVNLEAQPSQDPQGMDLPLQDITTLRFFYNLGIQQAKMIIACGPVQREQPQAQQQQVQNNSLLHQSQMPGLNLLQANHMPSVSSAGLDGNSVAASVAALLPNQMNLNGMLINPQNLLRTNQMIQQQQQLIQATMYRQNQLQQLQQSQQAQAAASMAAAAQPTTSQSHMQAAQLMAPPQPPSASAAVSALTAAAAAHQPVTSTTAASFLNGTSHAEPSAHSILGIQQATAAANAALMRRPPIGIAASQSNSQPPSAKSSTVSPPDAMQLHAALLSGLNPRNAVTGTTAGGTNLHEARFAQLLQEQIQGVTQSQNQPGVPVSMQAMLAGLNPALLQQRAQSEAAAMSLLKPVAVGGGSGDAAVSPRPRSNAGRDMGPPAMQQHSSSPSTSNADLLQSGGMAPVSSAEPSDWLRMQQRNVIGANRPESANQATPQSASSVEAKAMRSAPGTPANHQKLTPLTEEDAHANSHLFTISEKHFNDAFNSKRSMQQNPIQPNEMKPNDEPVEKKEEDKPALAPILMMSFLNNCFTSMKSSLSANGNAPQPVDMNGQPIDYSATPIDPIFAQARHSLNQSRSFSSPNKRPATSTPQAIVLNGNNGNSHNGQQEEDPNRRRVSPSSNSSTREQAISIDDDSDDEPGAPKRLRIATDED